MKELTEMSWGELTKLREQLQEDLGYDPDDENDDYDDDYEDGEDDWEESSLLNALGAMQGVHEAKQPSVKKDALKSPPKGYPSDKSKYADPTNYKYPLDTVSRVHAALSYFSNPDNIKKGRYSPEEQKFMWRLIIAAAKKFGIQLSDDVKKRGEKLGEELAPSNESAEVSKELNEQEIIALIEKTVKDQMTQNPGGMLAQGTKGHGGMESYQPQVRIPPDLEDLHNQLEAFKKQHVADTEAFGKKHEDFAKSNKELADKVDALTKQVQAMQETMKAETQDTEDSGDTEDSEDSDDSEDSADTGDVDTEDSVDIEEAEESKESKEEPSAPPSDKGKKTEAEVKKHKEAMQQAQPEGLVATNAMTEGTGVTPPGFASQEDDPTPKSFRDIMNKATRLRRHGIGGA